MVQYISFHCGKFNQTFPSTQFDKTLLICTNYFVSHRKIADIPLLCLTMRQLRVINEMRTDKVDRYLFIKYCSKTGNGVYQVIHHDKTILYST